MLSNNYFKLLLSIKNTAVGSGFVQDDFVYQSPTVVFYGADFCFYIPTQ